MERESAKRLPPNGDCLTGRIQEHDAKIRYIYLCFLVDLVAAKFSLFLLAVFFVALFCGIFYAGLSPFFAIWAVMMGLVVLLRVINSITTRWVYYMVCMVVTCGLAIVLTDVYGRSSASMIACSKTSSEVAGSSLIRNMEKRGVSIAGVIFPLVNSIVAHGCMNLTLPVCSGLGKGLKEAKLGMQQAIETVFYDTSSVGYKVPVNMGHLGSLTKGEYMKRQELLFRPLLFFNPGLKTVFDDLPKEIMQAAFVHSVLHAGYSFADDNAVSLMQRVAVYHVDNMMDVVGQGIDNGVIVADVIDLTFVQSFLTIFSKCITIMRDALNGWIISNLNLNDLEAQHWNHVKNVCKFVACVFTTDGRVIMYLNSDTARSLGRYKFVPPREESTSVFVQVLSVVYNNFQDSSIRSDSGSSSQADESDYGGTIDTVQNALPLHEKVWGVGILFGAFLVIYLFGLIFPLAIDATMQLQDMINALWNMILPNKLSIALLVIHAYLWFCK